MTEHNPLEVPHIRLHLSLLSFNQPMLLHSRLSSLDDRSHEVFAKHGTKTCLSHLGGGRIQPWDIFAPFKQAHFVQFLSRESGADDDSFWCHGLAGVGITSQAGRWFDVLSFEEERQLVLDG